MLHQTSDLSAKIEPRELGWQNCPHVLRFALASVYTRGAIFRRQLIRDAINPIAAPPLEIGIDPRPVVFLAWKVEKEATAYRALCAVLCVALVALTVITFLLGLPIAFIILLVFAAALICGAYRARTHGSVDNFSRSKFDIGFATTLLKEPHPEELEFGLGSPEQNVVVHEHFEPFSFAGTLIGKWSFTVDVERPAQTTAGNDLQPVSGLEIETAIKQEIPQSGFGALHLKEILAVHGEDASVLPMIVRYDAIKQPNVSLTAGDLAQLRSNQPYAVRHYLLFYDIRWSGELILTHVVRTSLQGRIFHIETSRFVLGPPWRTDYKSIDQTTIYESTSANKVRAFLLGALGSPFIVVAETFNLLAGAFVWQSSGGLKREYSRNLKKNPIYNYGSSVSFRRKMMSGPLEVYSQKADIDFAVKAFDQTIVEVICRYMDDHGVDVSDLRNKAMTIYNSGIMVEGGNVTAQAMAVGQGANAKTVPATNNIVQRRDAI